MFRDPRYGELQTTNAHMFQCTMTCDVPMVYLMRLLRSHLYIYEVKRPKFMKLPMDSSSITQSLSSLL